MSASPMNSRIRGRLALIRPSARQERKKRGDGDGWLRPPKEGKKGGGGEMAFNLGLITKNSSASAREKKEKEKGGKLHQ